MKIKIAIASAMIVGSGLLIAPAAASASYSECDEYYMCLWGNNDYLWLLEERNGGLESFENLEGESNNEMDSWADRDWDYVGCMYGSFDGTGDKQDTSDGNDNNVAPWNSDEVSSWRTKDGC